MKPFYTVGSVVSLVLLAVGFFWLRQLGLFGTGLSLCILGLIAGPVLAFGLYLFYLRERIDALEKRVK